MKKWPIYLPWASVDLYEKTPKRLWADIAYNLAMRLSEDDTIKAVSVLRDEAALIRKSREG